MVHLIEWLTKIVLNALYWFMVRTKNSYFQMGRLNK